MRKSIKSSFLPDIFLDNIYEINIENPKIQGIKAFVFDIDNTLVTYSTAVADEKLKDWISELKARGNKLFLASNNSEERVKLFANSIECEYIPNACKPLGFKIKKQLKKLGIKPSEAILVGDQLFTDVWCAKIMGMSSILVKPISDKEGWFIKFKRNIERWILK